MDSKDTYSHQKCAAEIRRDNRRRPTMKDDITMKITLNATNDGTRFSLNSVMSTAPRVAPARKSKRFPKD